MTRRLYLATSMHHPVVIVVARQLEAVLHHHLPTVISADVHLTHAFTHYLGTVWHSW